MKRIGLIALVGCAALMAADTFSQRQREFWSFQKVKPQTPPAVKNSKWVRNPIDAFVAAEHEKRGLKARSEASREVLLKRIYLDVIGLLPTVAEQGLPDFEATQWVGLLTAAGTPREVVARLNTEVNKALRAPELITKLAQQGMSPGGGTPDEFGARIVREIENWKRVARDAGIRPE